MIFVNLADESIKTCPDCGQETLSETHWSIGITRATPIRQCSNIPCQSIFQVGRSRK